MTVCKSRNVYCLLRHSFAKIWFHSLPMAKTLTSAQNKQYLNETGPSCKEEAELSSMVHCSTAGLCCLHCSKRGAQTSPPLCLCKCIPQRGAPSHPEPWYPGSPWPLHISSGVTYQPSPPWMPFPSLFATGLSRPVVTTHLEQWPRSWLCASVMVYLFINSLQEMG